MTWRLRVEHTTNFRYARPVTASYNEARLSPLTDLHQTTLSATIETTPGTRPRRYWDWFGTLVHAFDLHEQHDELTVAARSVVEVDRRPGPGDATALPSWSALAEEHLRDRLVEYLTPTAATPADEELAELAKERTRGLDPAEAAEALGDAVRGRLEYRSGSTGVHTTAPEAWREGVGVCQDYAHVALVMARAVGLPARYVSGYLHPAAEVEIGSTAVGESHAWVELWLGDWIAYDVTNGSRVHERHVTVGRGRDYSDVSPLRGVFAGGATEGMSVEVLLERLR